MTNLDRHKYLKEVEAGGKAGVVLLSDGTAPRIPEDAVKELLRDGYLKRHSQLAYKLNYLRLTPKGRGFLKALVNLKVN